MSGIENNINMYVPQEANYGMIPQAAAINLPQQNSVNIPEIYYTPDPQEASQTFEDRLKKIDFMGLVYPWYKHPLLMVGSFAALAYGVDKFSNACSGEYETSLLGRASAFGDRIQNSDFIQNKNTQSVLKSIKNGKNRVKNLFKKSDVIQAMKTTPTRPEWKTVTYELEPLTKRVEETFVQIINTLKLGEKESITPEALGVSKEEKNVIKALFKKNSFYEINPTDAASAVQLKRLGRSDAEIMKIINSGAESSQKVKEEILKEMGLTVEDITKIKSDTEGKYIKKVMEASSKVKGRVKIGAGEIPMFRDYFQPFKRTIGCDEVYNRLYSISNGAKTATGRFMSNFLQKLHRGFTFGGGKMGLLIFVSPLLVEAIMDTKKAESDQKVGTLAQGIVRACSWVFTFPLGLKIMHSMTGSKYAGMGKDKVEQYRKLLNDFNSKVVGDGFKNYAEYKEAKNVLKKELKALKKVDGQNLLTKLCRKLGSFFTLDLETIKSYRGSNIAENILRKIPNFFRNVAGVPMRFIIWGLITMGVLDTAITKGTKALTGNYYDRFKEEEFENNKKKQKIFTQKDLQTRLQAAQAAKLNPDVKPENTQSDKVQGSPEELSAASNPNESQKNEQELLAKMKSGAEQINPESAESAESAELVSVQPKQESEIGQKNVTSDLKMPPESLKPQKAEDSKYIPNQNTVIKPAEKQERDNYTYIPSQNSVLQDNNNTPQNKYIPSQIGANFTKTYDNSGLDAALKRANRAEQRALEVLSGKF